MNKLSIKHLLKAAAMSLMLDWIAVVISYYWNNYEENKNISEKTAILEAKLKTIVDTIGAPKKKVQKEVTDYIKY